MADARPDLWSSLRDLAARSWHVPLENAQRTRRHLGQVLDGQAKATDILRETGRWVRDEYGDYARDVAATGLDLAGAVIDLNLRYQRRFVDAVFPAADRPILALSGAPGQPLIVELSLDNDLDGTAQVEVSAGALRTEGQDAIEGAVVLSPDHFELEAGASQAVTLTVTLDGEGVWAGQRWQGDVVVRGIGDRPRRIQLAVDLLDPPVQASEEEAAAGTD